MEGCEISLCSKGFFTVFFHKVEDYQRFFDDGPWFEGKERLFITPWIPKFDSNKMSMTKTLFWIRILDLPLHFWSIKTLEAIGSKIGKFLKIDIERVYSGLATSAQLCVEYDLGNGLPDKIILKWKNSKWTIQLDYENTTFTYRICL